MLWFQITCIQTVGEFDLYKVLLMQHGKFLETELSIRGV